MEDQECQTGFINTYNHMKGFGFIRRKKGRDVFFFFEDFETGNADITIGESVKFTIEEKTKGPRAYNIRTASALNQDINNDD